MDLPTELVNAIEDVKGSTDGWPWYWLSYGEKCYAFATVEAHTMNEGDQYPRPGSRLEPHPDFDRALIGENGTAMLVNSDIASIEHQNGADVCRFIAEAHAALCSPRTED